MKKLFFFITSLIMTGCASTDGGSGAAFKSKLDSLNVVSATPNDQDAEQKFVKSLEKGIYDGSTNHNEFFNNVNFSENFPANCKNITNFNNTYYGNEAACQCYLFEKTNELERISDTFTNDFASEFRANCANEITALKQSQKMSKLREDYCNEGQITRILEPVQKELSAFEKRLKRADFVVIDSFKKILSQKVKSVCSKSIDNAFKLSYNYSSAPAVCFTSDYELLVGAYGESEIDQKQTVINTQQRCESFVSAKYKNKIQQLVRNAKDKNQQYANKKQKQKADKMAKEKKELKRKAAKEKFLTELANATQTKSSEFLLHTTKVGMYRDLKDIQDVFYMTVAKFEKQNEELSNKKFVAGSKGEFETQSEYVERISKEKQAFEMKKQQQLKYSKDDLGTDITRSIGRLSVNNLQFDADKQEFVFNIVNSNGNDLTKAVLPMPTDQAKKLKNNILNSSVHLIFAIDKHQTQLSLRKLVLSYDAKDPTESKVFYPNFRNKEFSLDKHASRTWLSKYTATKKAEEEERKHQELAKKREIAKTHPYIATLSCSYGRLAVCLGSEGSLSYATDEESVALSGYDLASDSDYEFRLTNNFRVKAQNGSRRGRTLSLEIKELLTGKLVYTDSVTGSYQIISVKN